MADFGGSRYRRGLVGFLPARVRQEDPDAWSALYRKIVD
ncbi:hypothetical protein CP97_00120 [Aurantiacibacter atlanticus]|uniref:Uncharacterized protein n=1 Tax=Aurantiacibacter atlanticus TaxID=1648404 RepID=A0A0H4V8H3_9SPHN|nr:hypothetical protein CP97_00120 [Aurantiacibacter atlanticus]